MPINLKGAKGFSGLRSEAFFLGGSDKAIILEYIRYSIGEKEGKYNYEKSKYCFDGYWWMQDSYEQWQDRLPWLSLITIKRYVKDLCDLGVLVKKRKSEFGGGNQPNFYRIDEDTLNIKMALYKVDNKSIPTECQNDTQVSIKQTPTLLYTHSLTHSHSNLISSFSPELLEFAKTWYDFALREMKWTKPPKSWSVESFAVELDKVMKLENINLEGMKALLKFIEAGFWATVISTPKGLLKLNEEKQRRITTILRQMKPKAERQKDKHEAMSEEEKQRIDNETMQMFGFGGKK